MKAQAPGISSPHVAERENRLLLAFATWQLGLHLWQCSASGDPRLWPPHAVAYLSDVLLLGAAVTGARVVRGLLPDRLGGVGKYFAVSALLVVGPLLAIYPQVLREYLAFPVNIFAADGGSARVLLTEYLGVSRLWPAAVAFIVAGVALILPVQLPDLGRSRLVIWTLIVLAGVVTVPRSPHPFLYSLKLQTVDAFQRSARVVPSLRRPPPRSDAASVPSGVSFAAGRALIADRVFLIVLEGVTSADFEAELLGADGGFFSRVKDRAAYHRGYHATNLDSYTSLIAMLTSIQVPYRAYADESLYGAVNRTENLTRALRERGYFTAFISTYEHQPFVPTRNDWNRVLDRPRLRRTTAFRFSWSAPMCRRATMRVSARTWICSTSWLRT